MNFSHLVKRFLDGHDNLDMARECGVGVSTVRRQMCGVSIPEPSMRARVIEWMRKCERVEAAEHLECRTGAFCEGL